MVEEMQESTVTESWTDLPISKPTRVRFEAIRTFCALSQVAITVCIALRVYGVL